jgi:hypothetical protein
MAFPELYFCVISDLNSVFAQSIAHIRIAESNCQLHTLYDGPTRQSAQAADENLSSLTLFGRRRSGGNPLQ